MTSLFNYLIESGAALAVFYLFYWLLLRKQANFRVNRMYLLGAACFSIILPFLEIPVGQGSDLGGYSEIFLFPLVVDSEAASRTSQPTFPTILKWAYLVGVLCFAATFILQHRQLHNLWKTGQTKRYKGMELVCLKSPMTPFSFFNRIFVHQNDLSDLTRLEMILQHELIHVRNLHSVDNYLMNLLAIAQWFNPFVWMLRKEIRNVHEYEADHETIERKGNSEFYKHLLFNQAMRLDSILLVNNFNSSLKNRLLMLQKQANLPGLLKGLVFLPLALAMLFVFSCSEQSGEIASEIEPPPVTEVPDVIKQNPGEDTNKESSIQKNDEKVFVVVEQMPTFQDGGINAFRNYLQQQVEYPREAAQAGIEGTVFVKFMVNKQGKTDEIEVMRGVHENLDQAVIALIENSPDWEPGKQRGRAVNVQFTLPVVFKLK